MKASQYVAFFEKYPKREDLYVNDNEILKNLLKEIVTGLIDEILPSMRTEHTPTIQAAVIDANRKFRVIRGMLKSKYGESILRYDGFASFLEHNFQEFFQLIPNLKEALK